MMLYFNFLTCLLRNRTYINIELGFDLWNFFLNDILQMSQAQV